MNVRSVACRLGWMIALVACGGGDDEAREASSDALCPTGNAPPAQQPAPAAATPVQGPRIDTTKIPTGHPGSGEVLIRPTTERPGGSDGTGAFRTVCEFSHMNFDDPIVFPGIMDKAHLHTFFGNTRANAFSTADSLAKLGNSTCRGGIANRSSYWVPALVDPQGAPVAPIEAHVYYKTGYGGVAPRDVRAFPQGLRMIAGDAKAATPDQDYAYWDCLNDGGKHPRGIPSCSANDEMQMTVEFPQCWDGKNLDSPDHKSHMAYPEGRCPATHPVAIPAITFNIRYKPIANPAGYHLSSDAYDAAKPGGYSAHGDWFSAWDQAIVDTFVKNCDNAAVDCHSHLLGDGREMFGP